MAGLRHPEEQKQAVLEAIKCSANSEKSPGMFYLVCPLELVLNPAELLSPRVMSFRLFLNAPVSGEPFCPHVCQSNAVAVPSTYHMVSLILKECKPVKLLEALETYV